MIGQIEGPEEGGRARQGESRDGKKKQKKVIGDMQKPPKKDFYLPMTAA
jgi:hypothetical protein